jgi:hypothetical protein
MTLDVEHSDPKRKPSVASRGRIQLILLSLILTSSVLMLAMTFRAWRILERINRPELYVSAVHVNQKSGPPLALVVNYVNAGRTIMRWLEFRVALFNTLDLKTSPTSLTVVRANPAPPRVMKSMIVEIKNPPKAVALCARWLDEFDTLSSSDWYFDAVEPLDPANSKPFVDAAAANRGIITAFRPCRADQPA